VLTGKLEDSGMLRYILRTETLLTAETSGKDGEQRAAWEREKE
jgi:hypothetical protein